MTFGSICTTSDGLILIYFYLKLTSVQNLIAMCNTLYVVCIVHLPLYVGWRFFSGWTMLCFGKLNEWLKFCTDFNKFRWAVASYIQKFKIAKLYEFLSWFVWMEKEIILLDEYCFLRQLAWIMGKINRLKNISRDWNDWNLNGFKVQKDKTILLKLTVFK